MANEPYNGNHFRVDEAQPPTVMGETEPLASPKKSHPVVRTIVELAIALAIALVITWALKTFVVEPFEVPTGSMEDTIMIGDKILTEKVSMRFEPIVKDDIIVFADKTMPGRILVKRVIATGGQVVDIKDGLVFIDGEPLYEPYTNGDKTEPLEQHFQNMNIEYPFTVPEGQFWVMGDNRDNSSDSRYFGTIMEETVYGKAQLVFWPLENIGPL